LKDDLSLHHGQDDTDILIEDEDIRVFADGEASFVPVDS